VNAFKFYEGYTLRLFTSFWALGTVARATTAALVDAGRVETTAHDSVAHTDVLDATTAKHDHGVFLEVVTLSRDVGGDFHAIRQAYASDLTDSRVWLARRLGSDARADTTFEGCRIEARAILEGIETTTKSHRL